MRLVLSMVRFDQRELEGESMIETILIPSRQSSYHYAYDNFISEAIQTQRDMTARY